MIIFANANNMKNKEIDREGEREGEREIETAKANKYGEHVSIMSDYKQPYICVCASV